MGRTHREKMAARAAKRREWAEGRAAKAADADADARTLLDLIPPGQPVLVGHHSQGRHERHLDTIGRKLSASVQHGRKAERHERAASEIESQLRRSVYDDDTDAADRLRERIAAREAERDQLKAFNRSCTAKRPGGDESLLDERQLAGLRSAQRFSHMGKHGKFPAYVLTNLGAKIRADRKRLEALERDAERAASVEAGSVPLGESGRGRWMNARFASDCATCSEPMAEGERIYYIRRDRAAHCERCAS